MTEATVLVAYNTMRQFETRKWKHAKNMARVRMSWAWVCKIQVRNTIHIICSCMSNN